MEKPKCCMSGSILKTHTCDKEASHYFSRTTKGSSNYYWCAACLEAYGFVGESWTSMKPLYDNSPNLTQPKPVNNWFTALPE